MTAAVPNLAAGTLAEDVFKKMMTCQDTALSYGIVACTYASGTDLDIVSPDATGAGAVVGLVASAGPITSGAYGAPAAGDALTVQRFGQAVGLLATNQTIVHGNRLGVVSGSGGKLGLWAPGMKYVGVAAQSKTTTSTPLFIEVDLKANPEAISVESIVGFAATTFEAATKYLSAPGTTTAAAAEVTLAIVPPGGGVIANLQCSDGTAPGGTDTDAFTVMRSTNNGSSWSATTLTATITGTAQTASDVTHQFAVNAGDLLAIQVVASATSAGANRAASFQLIQNS